MNCLISLAKCVLSMEYICEGYLCQRHRSLLSETGRPRRATLSPTVLSVSGFPLPSSGTLLALSDALDAVHCYFIRVFTQVQPSPTPHPLLLLKNRGYGRPRYRLFRKTQLKSFVSHHATNF